MNGYRTFSFQIHMHISIYYPSYRQHKHQNKYIFYFLYVSCCHKMHNDQLQIMYQHSKAIHKMTCCRVQYILSVQKNPAKKCVMESDLGFLSDTALK